MQSANRRNGITTDYFFATGSGSPTRVATLKVSLRSFLSTSTTTWSPCSTSPSRIFIACGSCIRLLEERGKAEGDGRVRPQARRSGRRLPPVSENVGTVAKVRALRGGNAQVLADFPGQVVVDFGVARNRRSLARGAVNVDRMVGSFAQQFTPVLFEVSRELPTLHALTFSGSRITSLPEAAS